MNRSAILALAALLQLTAAVHAATDIPLRLDVPQGVEATRWPVVVGVPFAPGARQDVSDLGITDDTGAPHPADAYVTMRWRDGSVKWARFAFVADLARQYRVTQITQPQTGGIAITETDGAITVDTGAARYQFTQGRGCFTDITLPEAQSVAQNAGDAFYLVDSQGRRAVMQGAAVTVEQRGQQHAVIRTEGDYLTEDGKRTAHGVVYFHFFAGLAQCKVSHKFIVTEETLDLWFRDIGMRVPVANDGSATATFDAETEPVTIAAGQSTWMAQLDYPHFGSETSKFILARGDEEVATGEVAGDWADLSTDAAGLAMQMPAFAKQFPTAFRVDHNAVTVKFWASESGRELDFRMKTVAEQYFGHDWIPADHKLLDVVSSGRASARTHDVWLYPHAAALSGDIARQFAATEHEIFAVADPAYLTSTGAIDPVHPYDPERFPRIEEAIEDYFVRNVVVPEQIFPNTGYLAWGRNPYTSQGWELKDGKWYPTLHRHGRFLEYNLRRCSWVLFLRSGKRMYHDHARNYTRFLGDFAISNWDTNLRPKGWFIQGTHWHSPAFWGAFDEAEIRADRKPHYISVQSTLGYGTSEDVIQHVYDWFVFGDYHSRDAAQSYKDAVVKEIDYDMDKMLDIAPTYVILRPVGSALEIDPDENLYNFMHEYLKIVVGDGSNVLNNEVRQNYVKSGEMWAGFYHYYISTRDELALQPLYRAAERYYRTNRINLIYRGSGMPQAFALTYDKTGDPAYLKHLHQAIADYATQTQTMADRGLDWRTLDRSFGEYWGHDGAITIVSPVSIGIPMALRLLAKTDVPDGRVPLMTKPAPTRRTYLMVNKTADAPVRIDLYINNLGDTDLDPKIYDSAGRAVDYSVVAAESHTVDKPHGEASWQYFYNSFNGTYGTHVYRQFQINAPPGVYRIDVGDQTTWSVLYSDAPQVMQVAPDGVVLEAYHSYYFSVAPQQRSIDFFAHRPVKLFTPDGKEAKLESLDTTRYRVNTAGKAGVWRIEPFTDSLASHEARVDAFVRFEDAPMALAMDDPSRLFDCSGFARFTDGRFGDAIALGKNEAIERTNLPADPPHDKGTIEFWYRPDWSVTDLHLAAAKYAMHRNELLRFDPILITTEADPKDSGRSATYIDSTLTLRLLKADGKQEAYPVKAYWQKGRWYHIAVTWRVDGETTDVEVFINGRRKTYGTYRGAIPHDLKPADLAPPAESLLMGSAVVYSYLPNASASFDALRVSRTIRYTDDFALPTAPPEADGDAYLVMQFDNETGTLINRSKLSD